MKWILIFISCFACSSKDDDRFEFVDKLRALGVESTIIMKDVLVTKISISILAPTAKGTIESAAWKDPQLKLAVPIELTNLIQTKNQVIGPLTLYTFSSDVKFIPMPPNPLLDIQEVTKARYGFKFTQGSEEEIVVGDILRVSATSESIKWQKPDLNLVKPSTDSMDFSAEIPLEANITKKQDEAIKVSWFVSDGEVANNRAEKTIWKPKNKGKHMLLFAVYPKRSKLFNLIFKEIELK